MQSVQQTYVFNQTAGAVTETVNGNWLQAYCEFLGVLNQLILVGYKHFVFTLVLLHLYMVHGQ